MAHNPYPEPNWDKTRDNDPYERFIHELHMASGYRIRMGNRYTLEVKDIGPRSCIESWVTPKGVFMVQRWADTTGFEYYLPGKDDHRTETAIANVLKFAGIEQEVPCPTSST